jgi:hypothetical protein
VNEAAHLLHFFFLDELEGIEVADLAGDLAGIGRDVERGDAINAALAGEQRLPDRVGRVADGTDQADAGDYDASLLVKGQSVLRIALVDGPRE